MRHAEFVHRGLRASLPFGQCNVAEEVHILVSHLTREKAARREVTEAIEEGDALAELGFRFLRPCDVIENLSALCVSRREECLPESLGCLQIQPCEPAAHLDSAVG